MANSHVFDLADTLLTSIETRFGAAAVGLPERRYVHAGEVADDFANCDQLVIALQRITLGLPGDLGSGEVLLSATLTAEFEVRLTRCVPTLKDLGRAPSKDELNAAGAEILTDAWVLPRALLGAVREGDLGDCRSVGLSGLTPIGPTGQVGGVSMTVTVDLT